MRNGRTETKGGQIMSTFFFALGIRFFARDDLAGAIYEVINRVDWMPWRHGMTGRRGPMVIKDRTPARPMDHRPS